MTSDEPFGRQPEVVTVVLHGDDIDVNYWMNILATRAEFKGDVVQRMGHSTFKIYPRAVND